jgi:ribonuclease-3
VRTRRQHQPADPGGAAPATADPEIASLAAAIGHDFAKPELLTEAMTHPGALAPARGAHGYQRLEWLGDRVLGLIVADLLWHRFATEPEGHLTRRHSSLVRRETLARIAAALNLGRYLILSPAEELAGTAGNAGILADACEAMIAAVYLDGGFEAAARLVRRLWEPLLDEMPSGPPREPKTVLQEWAQAHGLALPVYDAEMSGPDHSPRFTVTVRLDGFEPASATASSKRQAEAQAAALLLETAVTTSAPRKRRRTR